MLIDSEKTKISIVLRFKIPLWFYSTAPLFSMNCIKSIKTVFKVNCKDQKQIKDAGIGSYVLRYKIPLWFYSTASSASTRPTNYVA